MRVLVCALLAIVGLGVIAGGGAQRAPLDVPFEQSLDYQWLRKPVLTQRLLDDMEDIHSWTLTGKGEMALSTDPVEQGAHSLRISVKTRTAGRRLAARPAQLRICPVSRAHSTREDWSGFNRLSVWVWPDLPGWKTLNLRMTPAERWPRKIAGPGGP